MGARDCLAVLSLAALGTGCYLAWPPLGLIVPGGLVFVLLCASEWSQKKREDEP